MADPMVMFRVENVDPELMDLLWGNHWWRMAAWANAARSAIAEERWRGSR